MTVGIAITFNHGVVNDLIWRGDILVDSLGLNKRKTFRNVLKIIITSKKKRQRQYYTFVNFQRQKSIVLILNSIYTPVILSTLLLSTTPPQKKEENKCTNNKTDHHQETKRERVPVVRIRARCAKAKNAVVDEELGKHRAREKGD